MGVIEAVINKILGARQSRYNINRQPLDSKSILELPSYIFSDASENTIKNIDKIIGETVQFFETVLRVLDRIKNEPQRTNNQQEPVNIVGGSQQFIPQNQQFRPFRQNPQFRPGQQNQQFRQGQQNQQFRQGQQNQQNQQNQQKQIDNAYRYLENLRIIIIDDENKNENRNKKIYKIVTQERNTKYYDLLIQYIAVLKNLLNEKLDHKSAINYNLNGDLKKNLQEKLTKIHNYTKFFKFDTYIMDYARYVYMIYAIQIFKDLDDIYKRLQLSSALDKLNKEITFSTFDPIPDLTKTLQTLQELVTQETKTLPVSRGGSTIDESQNTLQAQLANYEENFKRNRVSVLVFFNSVNDTIREMALQLRTSYQTKFADIFSIPSIKTELDNIAKVMNNNYSDLTQDANANADVTALKAEIFKKYNIEIEDKDLQKLAKLQRDMQGVDVYTKIPSVEQPSPSVEQPSPYV